MTSNELLRLPPGSRVIVELSGSHELHGTMVRHDAKLLSVHPSREWCDVDLLEPHAGSDMAEMMEREHPHLLSVPIDRVAKG